MISLISSQFPLFLPSDAVNDDCYPIYPPWKLCDAPTPPPPQKILQPRLIPKKVEEVNTKTPQRQNDIYLTLNRHKKRFIKNLLRGTTFFEQLLQFTI